MSVPVERLRAMVALLGPSELTPQAKRMLLGLCEEDEQRGLPGRPPPPMPRSVTLALTVREVGDLDVPVAVASFADVTGDVRIMHFTEEVLRDVVVDGAVALRQLARGARSMPDPWLH